MSTVYAAQTDERTFGCYHCEDERSGWRMYWCPGAHALFNTRPKPQTFGDVAVHPCARHIKRHYPHPYVERCSCYGNNPVVERWRQQDIQRQREKAERDSR